MALGAIKHAHVGEAGKLGPLPVKKLRNKLMDAMSIQVIAHPVCKQEPCGSSKSKQTRLVDNPFWDTAPQGAFRKSKALAGFLTYMVHYYRGANILHLLERLSNYVWIVPMRHMIGMIHAIKSRVALVLKRDPAQKNPEALKRLQALIRKPAQSRVDPSAVDGKCRHQGGCAVMRRSTRLNNVRCAQKCIWMHSLHVQADGSLAAAL